MPAAELPDTEYLRQRLRYDPETGKLYWRVHEGAYRGWNTKHAGRETRGSHSAGYANLTLDGVKHLAHRIAWAVHHGAWPVDQIDHINGDRRDNRIVNLRVVSHAENCKNAACPKNNTSSVMGVAWVPRRQKWISRIMVRGVHKFVGYYDTIDEAAAARKNAEVQYGFHDNHGRPTLPRHEVSG